MGKKVINKSLMKEQNDDTNTNPANNNNDHFFAQDPNVSLPPSIEELPNISPPPVNVSPIESVWDVVGADNLMEMSVDPVVMNDKKSMFLYGLFLRDDKDRIDKILVKVPIQEKTQTNGSISPSFNQNQETTAGNSTQPTLSPDEIKRNLNSIVENTNSPTITVASGDKPVIQALDITQLDNSKVFVNNNNVPNLANLPQKTSIRLYNKYRSYIFKPNYFNQYFHNSVIFNQYYSDMFVQNEEFGIKEKTYSEYKLDKAYNIVPLPTEWTNIPKLNFLYSHNNLNAYANHFFSLVGFPYRSVNGDYITFPFFDTPFAKMSFVFRGKTPQESMLIAKNISPYTTPEGKTVFYKKYYPVIFLQDKHKEVYSVFAGLPISSARTEGKYLPLYNTFGLKRIEKAEKVVICGSLEDADAMQKYDCSNKTAYISFVCDPDCFYQVDFSPLKGKIIEFLISNHSGKSVEEERAKIYNLYRHLKGLHRYRIKEFCFRERIVQYPPIFDNYLLSDIFFLLSTTKPTVVEKTTYTESEFLSFFEPYGHSHAKNEQPVETEQEETIKAENSKPRHPGRPPHTNRTAEKTILRPFIRRGCTTVLTGDPGIGKSRFAIALAAQVAGSKKEFLTDRLWTRCLPAKGEKGGFKVVYWVFDDVDQDDIDLQRKFFAKGLSQSQEKNLFIEPARFIKKRDCESLKEELKKYSSRGTPNHPVDFLIVDTLLSFARSPAKIFSAFEELVRLKDEMRDLAIMLIHHNSKEGNLFGGVLATNMPRVIIEMKRDNPSVTDDLRDPITVNIIKHSNEHFGIDVVPFEIRLDGDHFVVTNNSDLPQDKIKKLVIYEYKTNLLEQYSSTDIGRLLGVPRKRIEKVWNKDVEAEAKDLWKNLRIKLKAEAKALNETSVRKKTSTRNKPVEDSQTSNKKGEMDS